VWDRYPKSNSFKYYHGQLVRINGGERKPLGGYSTDRYTDFAVDYIKKEHKKPWFLWLCYGGVHGPFTPAERHLDDYSGVEHINVPEDIFGPRPTKPSFLKNLSRWKKGKQGEVLNFDSAVLKYHRAVKAIDEGVGRVIKALKASGQLENTLIVFTSDQGYAWGQHGFKEKWMPYDDNIKAPLIFSWKGSLPEGKVCDVPVNGLDITSTFHEIANIQEPWEMHGRSLATLIKNPQAKWNQGPMILENTIHAYGEDFTRQLKNREEPSRKGLYPWIMLRDQNYKYIRHISKNKIEELYDMNKDPKELNNLAVNPEYHILLKEMRHKTIEAFKAKGADFMDHAYDPLVKVIP
jgi:arylsulfatase A-like enzyme